MKGRQHYQNAKVLRVDRTTGAFFEDDEPMRREISSFLSDYYRIHDFSLSDLNRAASLFDRTELGFVVLCADDPRRIFDALTCIRSRSNVSVVIIGPAVERYCVLALERGADDYIGKPASLREMLARIRVILRFERPHKRLGSFTEQVSYLFGGWRYDDGIRQLTNAQGRRVLITRSECSVLKVFLDAPQRVLTREFLVNATRLHEDIADKSIDTRILRLRRKLTTEGGKHEMIRTVRGCGYAFNLNVERKERPGVSDYASTEHSTGCPSLEVRAEIL
jgi:two-component system, OmpR family, response regulator